MTNLKSILESGFNFLDFDVNFSILAPKFYFLCRNVDFELGSLRLWLARELQSKVTFHSGISALAQS